METKTLEQLTAESAKGKKLTFIIIIAFLSVFLLVLIGLVTFKNINLKSASIFEDAYIKIQEMDKQSNVFSKEEYSKEILPILDQVILNYSYTVSGKRAMFYKGYVLYSIEKYEDASNTFKYLIEKYPGYYLVDKAYYDLAYCYEELGKIDEAINLLKTFDKKLNKSYAVSLVYYKIGNLYEKKSDTANATTYYQKIIDLKEESSLKLDAKKRILLIKNKIVL